jgi:RimJ/RimL family protein N-acetyltransferase
VKYDFETTREYLDIADTILDIDFEYDVHEVATIAVFDDEMEFCGLVLWTGYTGTDIEIHVASVNPKWLTRAGLKIMCEYPFKQLGVRRVSAQIKESNKASISLTERMGFVREGAKRDFHADGDSLLQYGMTKQECKWIK